jgi:hypothetical protein
VKFLSESLVSEIIQSAIGAYGRRILPQVQSVQWVWGLTGSTNHFKGMPLRDHLLTLVDPEYMAHGREIVWQPEISIVL